MLSSKNLDTKLIGDKYIQLVKKSIGVGAFAQVFEGYVKGNPQDKVAIKVLQNMPKGSISETIEKVKILYKREREIHATINSDHVVKLIDVVVCENTTNLILEFCEEGNLNKLLNDQIKRQLSQERAYQIFCQIVEGYKSLYNLKTLHRDLKPANILFSKGVAKIADFGFAKIIEEMDLAVDQTVVGTLLYQAPEMMVSSKYSSKVDIWSLGVIFYEMLYGVVPFMESHPNKLYKKITTEPLKFPQDQDVQIKESYTNLLTKMLKVDPEMRIRWDDLFLYLSKDSNIQVVADENLSLASTHMSDSDRFYTNYKKVEQQINKVDEIKDYFDYIQKLITFSNNNTTRLFFTLQQQLQISPNLQLLFSVTSTKYLLNEHNFYLQILQGDIPPSEINFKENDIKIFQSDQVKYYSVLNYFKTNQEQINMFYTEKLLPQYMKLKQTDQNNQVIQIVDELVKTNLRTKKSQEYFNKFYMQFIVELTKSIKRKQITDQVTLRQIYTLQINMFYSLHPQKFIQNEFEPKNLENEIIQSSNQQLENKIFDLNIMYSALLQ